MVWSKIKTRDAPVLFKGNVIGRLMPSMRNWASPVFQQLLNFRVVFRLDLLVVKEILLFAFMLHKLETMTVESVFILISRNVTDNNVLSDVRAQIRIWFANDLS
jgi:hypothetical protein